MTIQPHSQKDREIDYNEDSRDAVLRDLEEVAYAEHFRTSPEDYARYGE